MPRTLLGLFIGVSVLAAACGSRAAGALDAASVTPSASATITPVTPSPSTPSPSPSVSITPTPTVILHTKAQLSSALVSGKDLVGSWSQQPGSGGFGICGLPFPVKSSRTHAARFLSNRNYFEIVYEDAMSFQPEDAAATFQDFADLMDACSTGNTTVVEDQPDGTSIKWHMKSLKVPHLGDDSAGIRRTATVQGTSIVVDQVLILNGDVILYVEHGASGIAPSVSAELARTATEKFESVS